MRKISLLGLVPALLLFAASCEGGVGQGPHVPQGSAGPSAPSDAPDSAGTTRANDEAMRAADPDLYESARDYFPGLKGGDPPPRLVRLTRTQLEATARALLPSHVSAALALSMPRDPLQTNYEYAENLNFNMANFVPYTRWVEAVAKSVRAAPSAVIDCAASKLAPACLEQQAGAFVKRAFRYTADEATVRRYASFFAASVAEVGLADATADLVDVALSAPSYVFRDEVHTKDGNLLPAELLQGVSYTLADAPPEALGLTAAPPAEFDRLVDRVLASPLAREKLLRFFLAWLEVKEPEDLNIAAAVFPEFTPLVAAAIVADTRSFLQRKLAVDTPRLTDLTQATQAVVSKAAASLYGFGAMTQEGLRDVDPSQRLGIFTQPAVVVSHSGPTTTRLVKRGVFFTRKVMCLPLGLPPAGLDTMLPESEGVTERERIERGTSTGVCKGCHSSINPFGFMLESYDAIGRFRTRDEGRPVNPAIELKVLDEGAVTTATSVEALRAITNSLRFQQCFARQLFRYYMGREETDADDPTLREMFFQFAHQKEQDVIGMLRTLVGSSSFARRAGSR